MNAGLPPKPVSSASRKLATIIFVCFIISLGIAGFSIDWRTVPELLHRINWFLLPLVILSTIVSYWAAGLSFVFACRLFSFKTRTSIIWRVGFLSTVADNIAMLGNVGGHSVRLLLLSRFERNKSEIFAVSLFSGYFYQIVFIGLFPLSFLLLLFWHAVPPFSAVTLWVLALLFLALAIVLTEATFSAWVRGRILDFAAWIVRRFTKKEVRQSLQVIDTALAEGIRDSRKRPGLLWKLLWLTVVDWIMDVGTLWLCLLTLGTFVDPGGLLLGFVVGVSLGALSFIPGGLGVQDGSMIGIYALLGVPIRTSVLAVILCRIIYTFLPYFLSIFVYNDVVRAAERQAGAGTTTILQRMRRSFSFERTKAQS